MLSVTYAGLLLGAGFLVGSWAAGLARGLLERSRLDPEVRQLVVSSVRPLVLLLAVVAAAETIGVDLSGIVALLAVAALTVGLALHRTLSNGAAGAMLLTLRPFRSGDLVEAGGERGTVVDVNLFATTLKNAGGVLITVPNRMLMDRAIRNHTRNGVQRLELPIFLTHAIDPEPLERRIRECVARDPRVLAEPPPQVRFQELGPGGLEIRAVAWVRADELADTRSDLLRALRALLADTPGADSSGTAVTLPE
jgi:small conductance mechanosensitive channel